MNAIPPVVDAKDVLEDPERILRLLCDAVGVEFSEIDAFLAAGIARDRRKLGQALVW